MKKSRRFLGLIAVLTMLSAAITGCDLSGSDTSVDNPQTSVGGNHGSSDNGTDAPGKDTDAPAGETNAPSALWKNSAPRSARHTRFSASSYTILIKTFPL